MKLFALAMIALSLSAQAHFEIGTYKGIDAAGAECAMTFESVSFTTEFRHPLAERVVVKAVDKTFTLSHNAKVDDVLGTVMFSDETLEVTIPFKGGAEHFKVVMDEVGPTNFVHLNHEWKTNKISKFACDKLVFQGK